MLSHWYLAFNFALGVYRSTFKLIIHTQNIEPNNKYKLNLRSLYTSPNFSKQFTFMLTQPSKISLSFYCFSHLVCNILEILVCNEWNLQLFLEKCLMQVFMMCPYIESTQSILANWNKNAQNEPIPRNGNGGGIVN